MKKILFVTAHSYDKFPIESNQEYLEVLKEKLKSLCDDEFHIVPLPNTDKINLIEYLEDIKPYILHFSSHGNGQGEPILFDKFNIEPETFAEILKEIKSIECIFLNSCNSYEFIQKMKGGIRYYISMKFSTSFMTFSAMCRCCSRRFTPTIWRRTGMAR